MNTKHIEFINLKAQYNAYKADIDSHMAEVLESSSYILGKSVQELESNLAKFVGSAHARAISSGTDSLLVALMALGITRGDEVITTPFTFIATAEMIALLGAKPVFVDIDERTYNIDPNKIEEAITPQTKAIIPVSLYGLPADMDKINEIAKIHNLAVIEDACQSFGALYKGRKSCNLGKDGVLSIGVTSFFPSKPLGCYGDGGAIFCNNKELDSKITSILNHGQIGRYVHKYIGLNARLDSLQCAVLNAKLKYFESELATRQELAKRYNEGFAPLSLPESAFLESTQKSGAMQSADSNLRLILPFVPNNCVSVYAQYSLRLVDSHSLCKSMSLDETALKSREQRRESFLDALNAQGIPTAVHYPIPLHLQESLRYLDYKLGDFPVSEKVSSEIFSLPFSAFLTHEEQDYIIKTLDSQIHKL